MALYKRGKVYWYDFTFNGERYQESTKTGNLRSAEKIENKAKTDLALGRYGLVSLRPGPMLKDYAETFKAFVRTRNAAHPRTVDFYLEKLERLLEFHPLANTRINLIHERLIEDYIVARLAKVSKTTVNRELATLRRMLRVAMNTHKLVTRVPVIALLPGEVPRDFVLNYTQEARYLEVAEDTLRDFAVLSLDTGVRAGEGVGLLWDDVIFDPAQGAKFGSIIIRKGKTKNAARRLSMTPRVRAMLQLRREFLPDEAYVFPGRSSGTAIRVSSLDHQHVRARKASNEGKRLEPDNKLPQGFVVHSLRHTFATRLGESGADAFTIMKILGHSSITVSQRYVHPTPATMETAFERLESMNALLRGDTAAVDTLGVPTNSTKGRNEGR